MARKDLNNFLTRHPSTDAKLLIPTGTSTKHSWTRHFQNTSYGTRGVGMGWGGKERREKLTKVEAETETKREARDKERQITNFSQVW